MNTLACVLALAVVGNVTGDADAAKVAAEKALAANRSERAKARAEITKRLNAAYLRLATARRTALAAAEQEKRIEAELAESEATAKKASKEVDRWVRTLELAARGEEVPVGIQQRLAKLEERLALKIEDGEVVDRTGKTVLAKIVRAGGAYLAAGGPEATGLAVRTDEGPLMVTGVILGPVEENALRAAVAGGSPSLPIDFDGSLTKRRAPEAEAGWLESGGPFVWPILLVGLLGILLLAERVAYLFGRRPNADLIERTLSLLSAGNVGDARAAVSPAETDLARVLAAGIDADGESRAAALEEALLSEEPKLERSLTLIGACAAVAPLLGLLGTVTGMITTFEVITLFGTGNPRLLSGGISVALITTQLGLMVAIPLVLGHAWISRAVERRQALLEEARSAVLRALGAD